MPDLGGGGAEKALIELLKGFDYNLYKVSLCLLFNRGVYLNDIPKEVNVISLFMSERTWVYRKALKYYKKHHNSCFLALLIRWKIKRKYDVIISFMEGAPLLFHYFVLDRARRHITWVHCDLLVYHLSLEYFMNSLTEQECYEKMDNIVFVSRGAMANFNKLYQIDVAKRCFYNVLNVDNVRLLAGNKHFVGIHEKTTIIAIGSLWPVKGFDRLIRVAKMLKDSGCTFCVQILGEGVEEERLMSLRDSLGLQNYVSFLGFRKPPYPFLLQSDILISTSVSEGLSYVICEAFVLGVPVVATKTAGAVDLLADGQYGILTDHDDCSIYNGLKKMIDDVNIRRFYAEKAKERAKDFDVRYQMQKIYDLIENK